MGTREEGQHDRGPPDCTMEDCQSRACGSRAFPQVPKLQGFDDNANEAPHSTAQGIYLEEPKLEREEVATVTKEASDWSMVWDNPKVGVITATP